MSLKGGVEILGENGEADACSKGQPDAQRQIEPAANAARNLIDNRFVEQNENGRFTTQLWQRICILLCHHHNYGVHHRCQCVGVVVRHRKLELAAHIVGNNNNGSGGNIVALPGQLGRNGRFERIAAYPICQSVHNIF